MAGDMAARDSGPEGSRGASGAAGERKLDALRAPAVWSADTDPYYLRWVGHLATRELGSKSAATYARVVREFIADVACSVDNGAEWIDALKKKPARMVELFFEGQLEAFGPSEQRTQLVHRLQSIVVNQFLPWLAEAVPGLKTEALHARDDRKPIEKRYKILGAWAAECGRQRAALLGGLPEDATETQRRSVATVNAAQRRAAVLLMEYLEHTYRPAGRDLAAAPALKNPGSALSRSANEQRLLEPLESNPGKVLAEFAEQQRRSGKKTSFIEQTRSLIVVKFLPWAVRERHLTADLSAIGVMKGYRPLVHRDEALSGYARALAELVAARENSAAARPAAAEDMVPAPEKAGKRQPGLSKATANRYAAQAAKFVTHLRTKVGVGGVEDALAALAAGDTARLEQYVAKARQGFGAQRDGGVQAERVLRSDLGHFVRFLAQRLSAEH